jgi:sterol desaturase/sphingolipid hydroxylase (fatty acid hydroxylase superfamily)
MLLAVSLFIFTFLLTCFFGYAFHRFLHTPRAGRWYRNHLAHHQKLYPAHDFTSDKYRDAGKDDSTIIFVMGGAPLLLLPIVLWLCGVFGIWLALGLVVEILLIGGINGFLHDSFHITNHWIGKIGGKGYNKLVELHYFHHLDMRTNFSIFMFLFDRLFRTYKTKLLSSPRQFT